MKNTKEFTTVKGNTIESAVSRITNGGINNHTIIIPHVCNNVDLFGAGFAKALGDKFPLVKENFHLLGRPDAKLGKVQFVTAIEDNQRKNKVVVANMIAQNGIISNKNKRPINYAALVYCMVDVRKFYTNLYANSEETCVEIHAPKFGSGLAGGDWNFISELINDIWHDVGVYVYINHHTRKKEIRS